MASDADEAAHRAVGEVDEAVGAVDEDEADGQQRVDRAVDHAGDDDAERRLVLEERRRCPARW